MSAADTVKYFGYYLLALGLGLAVVPDLVLALILVPPVAGPFPHFVGMLVILIGYYYLRGSRAGAVPMLQASVIGRSFVLVFLGGMALTGTAAPNYVVLGLVDLAGAVWTAQALRREGHAPVAIL